MVGRFERRRCRRTLIRGAAAVGAAVPPPEY